MENIILKIAGKEIKPITTMVYDNFEFPDSITLLTEVFKQNIYTGIEYVINEVVKFCNKKLLIEMPLIEVSLIQDVNFDDQLLLVCKNRIVGLISWKVNPIDENVVMIFFSSNFRNFSKTINKF